MKKNLLSVLILALLIVNIVLTTIMMVSVTSTNAKTAKLVTSIVTVMGFELYEPGKDGTQDVSLADTESYDIPELMIPLSASAVENGDGTVSTSTKQSYIVFTLSLLQNKEHEDYKKLGGEENIATRDSLIKDVVNNVVGQYTLEELRAQTGFEDIRKEILKEIQQLFGSDFIYKIGISGVRYA